jgi:hypothetical protein
LSLYIPKKGKIMFRNFKMVSKVVFGRGVSPQLGDILKEQRQGSECVMVFLVDDVFKKVAGEPPAAKCRRSDGWVNVDDEPKTSLCGPAHHAGQKTHGREAGPPSRRGSSASVAAAPWTWPKPSPSC